MSTVFQCPHCSQPFRISESQQGKRVACPACDGEVRIPAASDSAVETPPPPPSRDELQKVPCPECHRRFAVRPHLRGREVACPHCAAVVLIGSAVPPEERGTEAVQPTRVIEPIRPTRRGSSSRSRTRWKDSDDLAANPDETSEGEVGDEGGSDSNIRKKKKRIRSTSASQLLPEPETIEPEPAPEEPPPISTAPQPIDHLLPPRFELTDPSELQIRVAGENRKVLLPDAKGGVQELDDRVVRVRYGSQEIQLSNPSRQAKQRRRLITNAVTITILLVVLAIIFYLLQKNV